MVYNLTREEEHIISHLSARTKTKMTTRLLATSPRFLAMTWSDFAWCWWENDNTGSFKLASFQRSCKGLKIQHFRNKGCWNLAQKCLQKNIQSCNTSSSYAAFNHFKDVMNASRENEAKIELSITSSYFIQVDIAPRKSCLKRLVLVPIARRQEKKWSPLSDGLMRGGLCIPYSTLKGKSVLKMPGS